MIWLIGGTTESRLIAEEIKKLALPLLITTATEEGREAALYLELPIYTGRMNGEQMEQFIYEQRISLIIDASHPYAREVSENSIKAAAAQTVPYLRYERESSPLEGAKYFSTYEETVDYLRHQEGKILLTIGSNRLESFKELVGERLFVRVLPVPSSLEKCRELGIKSSRIIAIQGPFSTELNRALLREYNIRYLVSKESGPAGGVNNKLEAARLEGIEPIIIGRPALDYPERFSDLKKLIGTVIHFEAR